MPESGALVEGSPQRVDGRIDRRIEAGAIVLGGSLSVGTGGGAPYDCRPDEQQEREDPSQMTHTESSGAGVSHRDHRGDILTAGLNWR